MNNRRTSNGLIRPNCLNCLKLLNVIPNPYGDYCRNCYMTFYIPYQQKKFKVNLLSRLSRQTSSNLFNFARKHMDLTFFNDSQGSSTNEESIKDCYCQIKINDVDCNFIGSKTDFLDHLKNVHGNILFLKATSECVWRKTDPEYQVDVIFDDHNEIFFLHRKFILDDDCNETMHWAMQHVGTSTIASNYLYTVQITYNGRNILYTDECTPNDDDIDVVINSGLCMSVPLSTLKTFMDEDGYVLCTVEIRNKLP